MIFGGTVMNNYIITADSGCDLSAEFIKSINVLPLCMKYIIDETEYTDTMQPEDLEKFFSAMVEGKMPKTAQLNSNDYTVFWEPLLSEGKDILHIAMSSGISGTYLNGVNAAEELMQKYPDRKICVIDSLMTSTGNGLLVVEAAKLRDEGRSFEEVCDFCQNTRRKIHACFTTDDITYLHRGGRVSKAGMILSKALHIYPVMHVNSDGELKVFAKARGTSAAWETVAGYIKDNCINPEEQTLYVSDASNPNEAIKLGVMLKERFGFKDVFYSKIGSIIGAHTGPGLLTLFFVGKER
ncbi:MAG: DegV family protein [Ruminococcaceae bacterium]|nr:DegV family protein [Oscillospiraceae bacterium]